MKKYEFDTSKTVYTCIGKSENDYVVLQIEFHTRTKYRLELYQISVDAYTNRLNTSLLIARNGTIISSHNTTIQAGNYSLSYPAYILPMFEDTSSYSVTLTLKFEPDASKQPSYWPIRAQILTGYPLLASRTYDMNCLIDSADLSRKAQEYASVTNTLCLSQNGDTSDHLCLNLQPATATVYRQPATVPNMAQASVAHAGYAVAIVHVHEPTADASGDLILVFKQTPYGDKRILVMTPNEYRQTARGDKRILDMDVGRDILLTPGKSIWTGSTQGLIHRS